MIHQIEKNEWLHELVFVLPQEKAFYYRFHFKASRKILLKKVLGIIKWPSVRDRFVFMLITENFERFQYFNFETNFLRNASHFQKSRVPFFSSNY